MEIKKTTSQMATEIRAQKVIGLYRSLLNEHPDAKAWAIFRTIGDKLNITGQAVYLILKKYNIYQN